MQFLEQGASGTRPPGQGSKTEGKRQAGEGIAQRIWQQLQGCAGLAGLALAVDLQGGLIEHGTQLGLLLRRSLRLEQRQGLGDVCRAEHRPPEGLKLLVEIGIAGGAGHGLAQGLEFGLGALDAGGLGVVGRAACLQAGDRLQGKKQQEAEGGGYG